MSTLKIAVGSFTAALVAPATADALRQAERIILGVPESALLVAIAGALIGVLLLPEKDTARWLELQWFPNRAENYGIEDDGPSLMQGFGQLAGCYRPGQGIMVGTQMTDQIIAAFAKGTTFAGMRVERKPWTSSIIQDPERVMHPVTIPWRGFFS